MNRLALCIGCNYPGTEAQLFGCVNDATDWRDLLLARDYEVVTYLELSRDDWLEAIRASIAQLDEGGELVVTISSHGTFTPDDSGDEPDGYDEAYVAADMQLIRDDEIYELMRHRAKGSRIVLLSDSCFSGSMLRLVDWAGDSKRRIRFLPPSALRGDVVRTVFVRSPHPRLRAKALPAGLVSISACRDDQTAADAWFGGRANGAFTRAAIDSFVDLQPMTDVLSGQLATVTYRDWHRRIRTKLPSRQYDQAPQLRGNNLAKDAPALGASVCP